MACEPAGIRGNSVPLRKVLPVRLTRMDRYNFSAKPKRPGQQTSLTKYGRWEYIISTICNGPRFHVPCFVDSWSRWWSGVCACRSANRRRSLFAGGSCRSSTVQDFFLQTRLCPPFHSSWRFFTSALFPFVRRVCPDQDDQRANTANKHVWFAVFGVECVRESSLDRE